MAKPRRAGRPRKAPPLPESYRERATVERAAKADVRQVPGDLAGVFVDRVTSMPELLREHGLITTTQATAACEYIRLMEAIAATGGESTIASIGMPRHPNRAAPREMSEAQLQRARRLHRMCVAAPTDTLPVVDGIIFYDLFPRRLDQITRLRRALDAMGVAIGLQPEPVE